MEGYNLDNLDKKYGLRKWVYWLIFGTIIVSLIVPFGAETICSMWFPDYSLGLSIWNQFTSIALGVVATVLSIVSLIMGFKNYDDTLALQEKHTQTLEKVSNVARDVIKIKEDVSRIGLSNKNVETTSSTTLSPPTWDGDPAEKED